jgi:arylsulfatase A-like enzyme
LTGRFPSTMGIHTQLGTAKANAERGLPHALDPTLPTIARYLRQAGYATGHYGKWHLGDVAPQEYGFDESRTFSNQHTSGWYGTPQFWRRSSELIADEAIAFIDKHREKPFYLDVWMHAMHAPLDPSEEEMKRFKPRMTGVSGTYTTPSQVYQSSLTDMDRHIGRILAKLDELHLTDNTIVVFSSDNGPEDIHVVPYSSAGSAGPFRGRKRSLYEGGIRVPFIVRWPGHAPANVIDDKTVLSGVDFLPSIAALCGVVEPPGSVIDGENMSGALAGNPKVRSRPLFWEHRSRVLGDTIMMSPTLAIRDGPWKLCMNADQTRVELYNIPSQPVEVDNLASENAAIVKDLSAKLLAWHASLPTSPVDPMAGDQKIDWPTTANQPATAK